MTGCNEPCLVYSRVVGYYSPTSNWNPGKKEEFKLRKTMERSMNHISEKVMICNSVCERCNGYNCQHSEPHLESYYCTKEIFCDILAKDIKCIEVGDV